MQTTCEAKGRVERANKTLQDRFIKEMRLNEINTMDEGIAFIPQHIEDYNRRFGKEPASDVDIHRPLQDNEKENIEDIFCWQEDRTLSDSLTVQYDYSFPMRL